MEKIVESKKTTQEDSDGNAIECFALKLACGHTIFCDIDLALETSEMRCYECAGIHVQ